MRRTLMGMSQEKLGDALGLTFQQVQKYERGVNRVGASRLFDISRVLEVPISFFFDALPTASDARVRADGPVTGFAETQASFGAPPPVASPGIFAPGGDDSALFSRRETVDLVRAYYRIPDTEVRRKMLDLIRTMAPAEP
nr:helix-turn-helix transcriptional regulator [Ameyamaea chiangmaiensis]